MTHACVYFLIVIFKVKMLLEAFIYNAL